MFIRKAKQGLFVGFKVHIFVEKDDEVREIHAESFPTIEEAERYYGNLHSESDINNRRQLPSPRVNHEETTQETQA